MLQSPETPYFAYSNHLAQWDRWQPVSNLDSIHGLNSTGLIFPLAPLANNYDSLKVLACLFHLYGIQKDGRVVFWVLNYLIKGETEQKSSFTEQKQVWVQF